MVHQRQRLSFGFEAGDDLLGVHAGLEDFDSHLAANRLRLFGHEDDAEAAFADLLHELVGADDRAGAFGGRQIDVGRDFAGQVAIQDAGGVGVGFEERGGLAADLGIAGAGLVQERVPLGGGTLHDVLENPADGREIGVHGCEPFVPVLNSAENEARNSHEWKKIISRKVAKTQRNHGRNQ
jgi:hypothetical protein